MGSGILEERDQRSGVGKRMGGADLGSRRFFWEGFKHREHRGRAPRARRESENAAQSRPDKELGRFPLWDSEVFTLDLRFGRVKRRVGLWPGACLPRFSEGICGSMKCLFAGRCVRGEAGGLAGVWEKSRPKGRPVHGKRSGWALTRPHHRKRSGQAESGQRIG